MTPGRLARLEPFAAPAALAGAVALRFHEYLLGGSVVGRDAVFFFVPLREVTSRLLSAGELPLWNDASGAGRALAANPNAAAFWPGTWLVPLLGTTGLFLFHVLLVVLLAYAALRALGLSRVASSAGGLVLLFSGVFQTVPLLFTTVASLAPIPLALAAIGTLDPDDGPGARRRVAAVGLALGLSLLGGEPVVAATGAAGTAAVALAGALVDARRGAPGRAGRRLGALAAAGLLSAGIAAVQLLPTAGELARSARGTQMRAEEGSLFWSVRPTRLLTLLEPRLTGDSRAEDDADYWGAATFDAGNPYFHDLALGLLPLALAAAAAGDPRGRSALGLSGLAALLSFGRFFPPVGMLLGALPVFRYPEKWWLLATLGLAGAAAVGVDRLRDDPRAPRRFARASALLAALLLPAAALAFTAPDRLAALLRAVSLAGDGVSGERVGALLGPLLLAALATALLLASLPALVRSGRISTRAAAGLAAALFLLDAGRRVTGSAPAGPASFWDSVPAEVAAAKEAAGEGRFYVDGADDVARATALARERAGLDPLRPTTGAAWGLRYGGDNDVDRMSTPESVASSATLARMPWGEEKVRRLRTIGVTAARTDAPGPDPSGVRATARFGSARIVVLDGARPEHHFVRRARPAPGALVVPAPSDPLVEAVVAGLGEERSFGAGEVTLLERTNGRRRLRARVAPPGGLLVAARTFDPSWTATVDGRRVESLCADGFLTAVPVPAGEHEVVFAYRNGRMLAGLAITLLALGAAASLAFVGRRG
ncbi:MAG TPA: hypothetical protein P5164_15975 [Thermoanaerobaculia bacterium]|nr:hypothetical protein [Thermoanaerobaculia bacterium]